MRPRAILAIARKDTLDLLLNKSTLVILLTPLLMAALFAVMGSVFSGTQTNILVYNPGNSNVMQVVSGAFAHPHITYASSAADVSAAFGPNGAHKSSTYAVGLSVPSDFDATLRAGGHPQLSLYVNGDDVNSQTQQLLVGALTDYSRSVATPQPPVNITAAMINPPAPNSAVQNLNTFFAMAVLVTSLLIGTSLVPSLLIEEKERKTLRMLMVTPASWGDIVAAKLLVGMGYQLVISLVVLGISQGFVGQIPLVLLFAALGSCFSVAVGVLLGSLLKTTAAAGAVGGIFSFFYIVPALFVGPIGAAVEGNPVLQAIKIIPVYYLADGILKAMENQGTASSLLLDVVIIVACIIALCVAAAWALRRQAAVASTI